MRLALRWQEITGCPRELVIVYMECETVIGYTHVCGQTDEHKAEADRLAAFMCKWPLYTPEQHSLALAMWLMHEDVSMADMHENAWELHSNLSLDERVTYSTDIMGLRVADVGDKARGYEHEWLVKYGLAS